jgi:hypothetical protein
MGGVMLEWRRTDEGALSAGLLAEKMVLALGRVLRGEELNSGDRQVLAQARDLFEAMVSNDVFVTNSGTLRMLDDGSYFDALHVVELQTSQGGLEERLREYADILRRIAEGAQLSDDDQQLVSALRGLFSTMGEKTLARAYEASRTTEDVTWRPTRQAISHF